MSFKNFQFLEYNENLQPKLFLSIKITLIHKSNVFD